MTSDPVRLFEDPTIAASLRNDLARATAEQVELHGLDLGAGLAALQSATATVTSSTTVVAGTSLLAKIGAGAAVAVGVLVLWLGLGRTSPDADEAERVAAPVVVAAAEVEGRGPSEGAAAAVVSPPKIPPAPSVVAPMPVVAQGDAPPEEALEVSPEPPHPREARPAKASAPSPEPPASDDGGLREAKLVAKAQSKLARDPAGALLLVEQAEREFPRGQLVEERRALAIQALVALGRSEEANVRGASFLAEYGRGAHAAAVRRALASD